MARATVIAFVAATLLCAAAARADIYSYTAADGVIHFTNVPQPGKPWRRIMRTGPGKAGAVNARRQPSGLSAARYTQYDDLIRSASQLYQVPEALVRAVISVESDYDQRAVSRVGARGLMQLMPTTAAQMGVGEIFDPYENIFGGVRYLRLMANRFGGDLALTLAAYHAGPGAVERYGGLPPYQTTHTYVRMVSERYAAAE